MTEEKARKIIENCEVSDILTALKTILQAEKEKIIKSIAALAKEDIHTHYVRAGKLSQILDIIKLLERKK